MKTLHFALQLFSLFAVVCDVDTSAIHDWIYATGFRQLRRRDYHVGIANRPSRLLRLVIS